MHHNLLKLIFGLQSVYEMEQVNYRDLGKISYKVAWDYQQKLLKQVIDIKLHNRNLKRGDENWKKQQHFLLFCEHPAVYTLGKSGSEDHLLLTPEELQQKQIEFFKINRGGDITFHGPGQIVGYPIFDLEYFFTDIHKYVRLIEEVVIRLLKDYGIEGSRIEGYTGVWIKGNKEKNNRKICAIGVHLSRWVTMHGFALNINTDIRYFDYIVPCGIIDSDKEVTSLSKELGRLIDINEVKSNLTFHFAELFKFEITE